MSSEYEVFQGKDYCQFGADGDLQYGIYQDVTLEPEGWYYIIADDPVGPFETEAAAIADAEEEI